MIQVQALELYQELSSMRLVATVVTYSSLMSACKGERALPACSAARGSGLRGLGFRGQGLWLAFNLACLATFGFMVVELALLFSFCITCRENPRDLFMPVLYHV